MSNSPQGEERLIIHANSNVSRGKFAAAAVHTALNHYGIDHGAVIVLGAKPGDIAAVCDDVVHDAGRTEVDPGTVTAGVFEHTHRPNPQERVDALRRALVHLTYAAEAGGYALMPDDIMSVVGPYL